MGLRDLNRRKQSVARTEAERVQREVAGLQERLAAAGYPEARPSKLKPLLWVLEQLQRPESALFNTVREFTAPDQGATPTTFDPLQAFWRGLTLQERPTGRNVAADLGLSEEPLFNMKLGPVNFSPSPAGIVGFGMDVMNPLDPLNYIKFGGVDLPSKGGETPWALMEKAFGKDVADDIFAHLGAKSAENIRGDTVGELVEDIMKRASKAGMRQGIDTDALAQRLASAMRSRGLTPSSRIMPLPRKAIGIQFLSPRTHKSLATGVIPGSESFRNFLSGIGSRLERTPLGQSMGRMFSTKFIPEGAKGNILQRMIRRPVPAEELPEIIGEIPTVARPGHTIQDLLTKGADLAADDAVAARTRIINEILESATIEETISKTTRQLGVTADAITPPAAFATLTKETFLEGLGADNAKDALGALEQDVVEKLTRGQNPMTLLPDLWYGKKVGLWSGQQALDLATRANQAYHKVLELGGQLGQEVSAPVQQGFKRLYRAGEDGEWLEDLVQAKATAGGKPLKYVDVPEGQSLKPDELAQQAKPYVEQGYLPVTPQSTPEEAAQSIMGQLTGLPSEESLTPVRGAQAYQDVMSGLRRMTGRSRIREQEFMRELDQRIFKGIDHPSRVKIMQAALYKDVYDTLPDNLKAATDAFKGWRQQVAQMYKGLGIQFTPLEAYVPFVIVGKPLTRDEAAMLRGMFGTGIKKVKTDIAKAVAPEVPSIGGREFAEKAQAFMEDLLAPTLGEQAAKEAVKKMNVEDVRNQVNSILGEMFGGETTLADAENLMDFISGMDPYIRHRTTRAIDPAAVNRVLGREWLTEDAAVAMARRGIRAIRGQEAATFLQGMMQKYGLKVTDLQTLGALPPGYTLVKPMRRSGGQIVLEAVKEMEGSALALPLEFAKAYNDWVDLLFNTEAKTAFGKFYDAATRVYKTMAYMWNPGHIPRDLGSNIYNLWLMDVRSTTPYVGAWKILQNPEDALQFTRWRGTGEQLLKNLQELELMDSGAILSEFLQVGEDWTFKLGGRYTEAMRKATRAVDNYSRLVGAVDRLMKGDTIEQAVGMTKKYLFDYFDLTSFEKRWMKRVIPFYTWLRKNIPLQVHSTLTQPGKLHTVDKYLRALGGIPKEGEAPDFIREEGGVHLPGEGGGLHVIPNLSYGDLANLPLSLESARTLLGGLNPLIRAPLEMLTNVSLFSGQPLERYAGEQQNLPLAELLSLVGVNLPTVPTRTLGYLLDQIPPLRNLSILANPEHPRRGARALSILGGPQMYPDQWVESAAAYEARDDLRALIRYLQDKQVEVPTLDELNRRSSLNLLLRDRIRRRRGILGQ